MDDVSKALLGLCFTLILGNWAFTFAVWLSLSKLNSEVREFLGYMKGLNQGKGVHQWQEKTLE